MSAAQGLARAMGCASSFRAVRSEHDFYKTPLDAAFAILDAEVDLIGGRPVLDPGCGSGALVTAAQHRGHPAIGTDIVQRWWTGTPRLTVQDFYAEEYQAPRDCVVFTTPPFSEISKRDGSVPWMDRCLGLNPKGVLMLAPIGWARAAGRQEWLERHPPTRCWQLCWRIDWDGRGRPTADMAWWVWRRGHVGPPELLWLKRPTNPFKW